jgi:site-specific DNA-methyltransferase (adenine-specific)
VPRRSTATSSFGSGKRESHDATGFYRRFPAPEVAADDLVHAPAVVDELFCADARAMDSTQVADGSVALVVTSPPYFAGKEYEEDLGQGYVPGSYLEYLDMLGEVLGRCLEKLEPGGRIAINVANLGRRPYRSLSADVIGVLQDDLGMLLRGEIIWRKAKGAGGSCAWGSFRSPANPVLRDLTERVIVASKGRFDRAVSRAERERRGLPHLSTMTTEGFLEATLDVWEIAAESASRVGHPAPFPLALPQRLIELYTYQGDLVLDPFIGSGTTALAARMTGRHYVGFDVDPAYLELASTRLARADGSIPTPEQALAASTPPDGTA